MSIGSAALLAAYALLVLLLFKVYVCTPWAWWVKLGASALVAATCGLSWSSLPALGGWPTNPKALPARFNVIGLHVEEPDKRDATPGNIYFLVTDMIRDGTAPPVPRAFAFPFSPELQAKTVDVDNKLHKNLPQIGERIDVPASVRRPHDPSHASRPGVSLEFFDLSAPLFPAQ